MHFVFYTDLEINKPSLTCSEDKLVNDFGVKSSDLIIGKIFKYKNVNYEIENIAPSTNTSPYHMESLLIKCKVL